MADLHVAEGFPDLFVFTLKDALAAQMATDPDFPAVTFLTRPVRSSDPSRTICVVENDALPTEYEIGLSEPSMFEWNVVIQVLVKGVDELEARNLRKRLLSRVRKTLFLSSTVSSLMTLSDGAERVSKYRVRRIDFTAADVKEKQNQTFFLLGQVDLLFQTEHR